MMSMSEPDTPQATPPGPDQPKQHDASRARTRRRAAWTAATVLVLAAAGGTAYALTGSEGSTNHAVARAEPVNLTSPNPTATSSSSASPTPPSSASSGSGMIAPGPRQPSSSPTSSGVVLPVTSYATSPDGRTLYLSDAGLMMSGCTHFAAIARQSASTVTVGLLKTSTAHAGAMCPMYETAAKPVAVTLSAPLGSRHVISLVTNATPRRGAVISSPGVVSAQH
jgi:hypothetical protein